MRGPVLVLAAVGAVMRPSSAGPPYDPDQALRHFRLDPGFRIELAVSEPDIQSPVAMEIDERGRWFVAEMPGYPLDSSPSGRIRLLEDTNHDGRPDRSRVFADGLVLPSGVMRWRRGVIVTSVPDVLYLEDADDDGVAERREVLVTGFARTNPQHMVNTPLYGLDNWIYLAHEGAAGAVIYTDRFGDMGRPLTMPGFPNHPPVDAGRQSVRFRPESGEIEIMAGQSQYGHAFDEWGRYFGSNNSNHIRLEVLAARYLARNRDLPFSTAMADISDHGSAARVFPITERPTYELLTETGEFTSACSLTPYTGGAFPGEYAHSTFVAEPVHNLVHRDVLTPDGASLRARRGSEGREFLASTDAWFRPVSFYVGPDGALYVVDYYRKRIEHPEWTASEFHKNPAEFTLGSDRGRIYRVVSDRAPAAAPLDPLAKASDEALVKALASPNLWWRRTAQRLLVERKAQRVIPSLVALAADDTSSLGQLHALWTLDALGGLDESLILRGLSDAEPGVRENALRLAEPRLGRSTSLSEAVVKRADLEPDVRVRFQVLATLGFIDSVPSSAAQSRLLLSHIDDVWMQRAALSAGSSRESTYLHRALEPSSGVTSHDTPARRTFFHDLGAAIGARRQGADIASVVAAVTARQRDDDAWWQAPLLEGVAERLRDHDGGPLEAVRAELLALTDRGDASLRRASLSLLRISGLPSSSATAAALDRAGRIAIDRRADAARRADAITLLALAGAASRAPALLSLVDPQQPEAVQVSAIAALSTIKGEAIARQILPKWPGLTPGARSAVIDLLLATPERQRILVDAISHGTVQPWAMSFWQKRDLLMNDDAGIRTSSRALLEESPERRAGIVNRYAAAVERGGDAARGQEVFARWCAACHHLGGGTAADVGPDLATIRHRPPLSLLVDILSPSQSIAQGYESYLVQLSGGRTEAGTLASQTAGAITLRQAGRTLTVPRRDIRHLTVVTQSTMPSDLDKVISPEDMANLLAYLTKR
jgi:putative membrane-bound dehydrogenase-like protein